MFDGIFISYSSGFRHWNWGTATWIIWEDESHQCTIRNKATEPMQGKTWNRALFIRCAVIPHPRSALRWRHNGHDGISNHQPHHCLLNSLFGCRSKKTSKLRVNGLCAGNSSGTGEFPAQMASNAENISIWWRHHGLSLYTHKSNIFYNWYQTYSMKPDFYPWNAQTYVC